MAGPGGGPPRKSHTKSRKGCSTCKRRHIRCDENFPQCRNCTKHNCKCDYRDNRLPSNDLLVLQGPNLLWTPSIEVAVENWDRTGISPFPSVGLRSESQFQGLVAVDLRLIYHLLSVLQDMQRLDLAQCTVWVQELPSILNAADGYDFVMSGVLAFAATHLAWLTESSETKNLAYHHRGVALKGLHDAIGRFSRENSDAILAASILLSWQASDWSGWTSLMQGISTILLSMAPWAETSIFASFIDTHPGFFSPRPPAQAPPFIDNQALLSAIDGLQRLSTCLADSPTVAKPLCEMLEFAQSMQSSSATMQCEAIFTQLQTLRAWLFWTPVTLSSSNRINASSLVLLAQLYMLALAVDISLPELRGAALGSLTVVRIDHVERRLRFDVTSQSHFTADLSYTAIKEAMEFPRSIAMRHQLESARSSHQPQTHGQAHQSPYDVQQSRLMSLPATPGFAPGTPLVYPISFGGPFPTTLNPSAEDPTPVSPFLHHGTPASRRHSPKLRDHSPFDSQSSRGYSFRDDSPAYSSSFHKDHQGTVFQGHSPASYSGEFVAPIMWA